MYNNSLQYLRHLDNSIRHGSNSTSCTRFRKDFDFWFRYGFPLFFSVWTGYKPKLVANSKNIAKETGTVFVFHMSD